MTLKFKRLSAALCACALPLLAGWGKGPRPDALRGWRIAGVDGAGSACFENPDKQLVVPAAKGKLFVAAAGADCDKPLTAGLPARYRLELRSTGKKVVLPLDKDGEAHFHFTNDGEDSETGEIDKTVRAVTKILTRGTGRRLMLIDDHGKATELARFQSGLVQWISVTLKHDASAPGGVIVGDVENFYGSGMCYGDSERTLAVHSRSARKGRVVLTRRVQAGDSGDDLSGEDPFR